MSSPSDDAARVRAIFEESVRVKQALLSAAEAVAEESHAARVRRARPAWVTQSFPFRPGAGLPPC